MISDSLYIHPIIETPRDRDDCENSTDDDGRRTTTETTNDDDDDDDVRYGRRRSIDTSRVVIGSVRDDSDDDGDGCAQETIRERKGLRSAKATSSPSRSRTSRARDRGRRMIWSRCGIFSTRERARRGGVGIGHVVESSGLKNLENLGEGRRRKRKRKTEAASATTNVREEKRHGRASEGDDAREVAENAGVGVVGREADSAKRALTPDERGSGPRRWTR